MIGDKLEESLTPDYKLATALAKTNAPQLDTVLVQGKKVRVASPTPPRQPYQTDPLLAEKIYDNILQTMGCMARVMELNAEAFAEMDEESLRFMLLMPLSIHYEGRATGETFHWQGKTDIIIKVGGRNIFIAQCLVWDGPEYFKTKIDQLLGYASWRDSKIAIIIFDRNKNLSAVLSHVPNVVKGYPNFKREGARHKHEAGFRFVLHHCDDKNRDLTLTVLVFDVPLAEG